MKSFTFQLLGATHTTEAKNLNDAKELILLRICEFDVTNGYWSEDVDQAKNSDLGKIVWNALSKYVEGKDEPKLKSFSASVRVLEWNTYDLTIEALTIEEARQRIEDEHATSFSYDDVCRGDCYNGTEDTDQVIESLKEYIPS